MNLKIGFEDIYYHYIDINIGNLTNPQFTHEDKRRNQKLRFLCIVV